MQVTQCTKCRICCSGRVSRSWADV